MRYHHLLLLLVAALALTPPSHTRAQSPPPAAAARPNVLILLADDWSAPHAGFLGDATVRTPNFDRLAAEGMVLTRAFVSSPSCTPSRAAMLTGRHATSLGAGGNLYGPLDTSFANYTSLLARAGYHVGLSRKGWGPGIPAVGGYAHNPAGEDYRDFGAFLAARPEASKRGGVKAPWCFWFGSHDPHRAYDPGSGAASGLDPTAVDVPTVWPDVPAVRSDVLDYYAEVERFDRECGAILDTLRSLGELDRTIVILTSDNGMPFPRGKANLYDLGTHVPLVVRWSAGGVVAGGVEDSAFVSLIDVAPTVLAAAGLPVPRSMQGGSLLPLLRGGALPQNRGRAARSAPGVPTEVAAARDARASVFLARERHANVRLDEGSYPMRAIRTADMLYVRNYDPQAWPAGDPEVVNPGIGPYGDVDDGPTKRVMLTDYSSPHSAHRYNLAFGRRPAEELYDSRTDPDQLHNLAHDPAYARTLRYLRQELTAALFRYDDPRALDPATQLFSRYPYNMPAVWIGPLGRDW